MRRIVFILLFVTPSFLHAASWSPAIALSAGYEGSSFAEIRDEIPLWSTARTSAELEVISFTFNEKHRLSFPIAVSYSADSNESGRLRIPGVFVGGLSLRYGYRFAEYFEIAVSADTSAIWHIKQDALSWRIGGTVLFSYFPLSFLAIAVPASVSYSPGAVYFSTGLMLRLMAGGII